MNNVPSSQWDSGSARVSAMRFAPLCHASHSTAFGVFAVPVAAAIAGEIL